MILKVPSANLELGFPYDPQPLALPYATLIVRCFHFSSFWVLLHPHAQVLTLLVLVFLLLSFMVIAASWATSSTALMGGHVLVV